MAVTTLVDIILYHSVLSVAVPALIYPPPHNIMELWAPSPIGALLQAVVRH